MEKATRPQRNRRLSRRIWSPEADTHHTRPIKRLFTPEIKRMLKDWLIRKRENPYPSRDEKKRLAIDTGLTYTQICNWFANWRRKLKNSEHEKAKKSWGHLIKNYNTNAKGNVEQFSISSEDSIWGEDEQQLVNDLDSVDEDNLDYIEYTALPSANRRHHETDRMMMRNEFYNSNQNSNFIQKGENLGENNFNKIPLASIQQHCRSSSSPSLRRNNYYAETIHLENNNHYVKQLDNDSTPHTATAQGFQIHSNGNVDNDTNIIYNNGNFIERTFTTHKTKYKQKMMEKYLRDTNFVASYQSDGRSNDNIYVAAESTKAQIQVGRSTATIVNGGSELSKWLESAANFTPDKHNYFVEWNNKRNKFENCFKKSTSCASPFRNNLRQHKAEYTATDEVHYYETMHHKDELDAAEALTNLAFNCRQRILDKSPNTKIVNHQAISS